MRSEEEAQRTEEDLATLANDLRLACQRIARRIRFEGTTDVAPHQFSVLSALANCESMTPTALAEQERVSTPSMTRTLNGLVETGLVRRDPHPVDRRQVLVSLTPAGREVVTRTMHARDNWMMSRLAGLPAHRRKEARRAADLLLELADSEVNR